MSQNHPPNSGDSQNPTQAPPAPPLLTATPNTIQDRLRAEEERLTAQTLLRLNEFLCKTDSLVASELNRRNGLTCSICCERFLHGRTPEVPVRLNKCGHVFGMNCILKWLSPVSRDGKNSCPNCRNPIFDDWNEMDYPLPHQVTTARRTNLTVAPVITRMSPSINAAGDAPTRALRPWLSAPPGVNDPTPWLSAAGVPREVERGLSHSPWAARSPGIPGTIQVGRAASTAVSAESADLTATRSSDTATIEAVAPNIPLHPSVVATLEALAQQQVAQGPQTVRTSGSRTLGMLTPEETNSSSPASVQRHTREAGSSVSQTEQEDATGGRRRLELQMTQEDFWAWIGGRQGAIAELGRPETRMRPREASRLEDITRRRRRQIEPDHQVESEARFNADGAAQRPAVAASPASAEVTRPVADEDDGVRAMSNAAEVDYDLQQQQEVTRERKRHMWMQFCEGVVRNIEQSDDSIAFANHDIALAIINMKGLDEFMAERAAESPTWHRILRTFVVLHVEMVTRFDDFRPLPSVNIDHRLELERMLTSARFNRETLHRARWYTRLSERLAQGASSTNHDAAVARSTERVANLSGPSSRATTDSATGSGRQRASEEAAREVRRMEDYLLGRTPIDIRREAAASVDAALRVGMESRIATTTVRRL